MVGKEFWAPWSESRQEYELHGWGDNEAEVDRKCIWKNRLGEPPGDWIPVRIPTPSQIEEAARWRRIKAIIENEMLRCDPPTLEDRSEMARFNERLEWGSRLLRAAEITGEGE